MTYKQFINDEVLTADELNTYLMKQVVIVFASATSRANSLGATPAEGTVTYLTDTDVVQFWDGANWQSIARSTDSAPTLKQNGTGVAMTFNWSGQGGQPTWLWGGSDGVNHYVYNPANFNVNYATSAGSAPANGGTASYVSLGATGARFDVSGDFYANSFSARAGVLYTGIAAVYSRVISGRVVRVGTDGTLGSDGSSRRWKHDIVDLTTDVDSLRQIRPVNFRFNDDMPGLVSQPELPQAGFIAEEVAEAFPHGALYDEEDIPSGVDDRALLAGAYKLIQDLYSKVEALEARIESLESA